MPDQADALLARLLGGGAPSEDPADQLLKRLAAPPPATAQRSQPAIGEAPWIPSAPDPMEAFAGVRAANDPKQILQSAANLGVGDAQPQGGGEVLPTDIEGWKQFYLRKYPGISPQRAEREARNSMVEAAPLMGARVADERFRNEHPYRAGFNDLAMAVLGGAGIDRNAVMNVAEDIHKNGMSLLGPGGMDRAVVSALPFVPNPEPTDRYTAGLAQASAEGSEKQARDNFFTSALPQAAAGFGGMGLSLAGTGAPLKYAGEKIAQRLLDRAAPNYASRLTAAFMRGGRVSMDGERAIGPLPGLVNMSQYTAMPAIENYDLAKQDLSEYSKQVLREAAKGAEIDLSLRVIGGTMYRGANALVNAEKMSARTADKLLLATPIAQSAALTGLTAKDGDYFRDFALNSLLFAGGHAATRLKPYLPGVRSIEPTGDRRTVDDVVRDLTVDEVANAPERAIPAQTSTAAWVDMEGKILDLRLGTTGNPDAVETSAPVKNLAAMGYPTPGSPEAAKRKRSQRQVLADTADEALVIDKKLKSVQDEARIIRTKKEKPEPVPKPPKEDLAEMAGPAPDTLEVRLPKKKAQPAPAPVAKEAPKFTSDTQSLEGMPLEDFLKLTPEKVAEQKFVLPGKAKNILLGATRKRILRSEDQAEIERLSQFSGALQSAGAGPPRPAPVAQPEERDIAEMAAPRAGERSSADEIDERIWPERKRSIAEFEKENGRVSPSWIQRKFGVSYGDATRLAERYVSERPQEPAPSPEPAPPPTPEPAANPPEPAAPQLSIESMSAMAREKALAQHIAQMDRPASGESEWREIFTRFGVEYSTKARIGKSGKELPSIAERVFTKAFTEKEELLGRSREAGKRAPPGKRTLTGLGTTLEFGGLEDEDLRHLRDDDPGPAISRMFSGIPVDKENLNLLAETVRSNDRNWYSRLAGFFRREAERTAAEQLLSDRVERATQINRYQEARWRPQYKELIENARDVYTGLVSAAGAKRAAATMSQVFGAKVLLLANAPWKRELIARYIYDAQARAMIGQGKNPSNELFLTQEERALVKKHWDELLPALQEMRRIKDIIDDIAPPEEADIRSQRVTDDPIVGYWRLARIGEFDNERMKTLIRVGNLDGRETVLLTGEVPDQSGRGVAGGRPSTRSARRRAGSARAASGQSESYSIDPVDMIRDMAQDRLQAVAHNRLRTALRNYAVDPDAKTVFFAGKEEHVGVIDLKDDPPWYRGPTSPVDEDGRLPHANQKDSIAVPETLKKVWERHILPRKAAELPKFLKLYGGGLTHAMLLQGGEAIGHVAGLLGAISSMPELGRGPVGKILAKTGLGRVLPAIAEVYDVKPGTQEFERDFLSGMMHAALGRSFDEFSGERIPILSEMKEFVFGPKGVEVRARIAMYRLLKRGSPDMSDAEAWYLVNDRMGTYVRELAPTMANLLSGTFIDPFARPGIALGKGAARAAMGFGAESTTRGLTKSWRAGTVLWSTAMTVGSWALLAKLMDNQDWVDEKGVTHHGGRWPWQSGLRFGYIRIGSEEFPLLSLAANQVWRGLSLLGIREASNSVARGADSLQEVAQAAGRGFWNATVGRLGPQWRTPVAFLSGLDSGRSWTPYRVPGRFLEIGTATQENPIGQAAKNAIEVSIPQYGDYVEQERAPDRPGESNAMKAIRAGLNWFGAGSRPAYTDRERAIMRGRAKNASLNDVVSGVIYQVQALPVGERRQRAVELLSERLSGHALVDGMRALNRHLKGAPRSDQRNFVRGNQ